jgi:hypothetical protein
MAETDNALTDRVARLEQEVALLKALLRPDSAPVRTSVEPPLLPPSPTPAPPRAATRPRPPATVRRSTGPRLNPVVLVAGAGAAIFLAGAAYFLHLAIERGWVGPEMRFLMGLAGGGALAWYGGRKILGAAEALGACLLAAGLGTVLFSLYTGAFVYRFYAVGLGFAGAAAATLVAGGLAARARSGAALAVALLAGLAAPLLFGSHEPRPLALALYLAALLAAATAVPYLARTGARWIPVRWLALAGVWALLAVASDRLAGSGGPFLALVALHYLLAGLWIWLPGQGELPAQVVPLWAAATLAASGLAWVAWESLGWLREAFAAPLAVVAVVNLALVRPARLRLGGRKADLGLLALAAAHLALLVPVALAWRWVGAVWGLYALALAWAAGATAGRPGWEADESRALGVLAWGLALLASLRWAVGLEVWGWWGRTAGSTPFLNLHFLEGLLAAGAWALLARRPGLAGQAAGVGLELVANLSLALEAGRLARWGGAGGRAEDIVRTVVLAASGAAQWVLGLRLEGGIGRLLTWAGYGWLGIAGVKLILADLAGSPTPLRALALLAVGGIFLGAAVAGNRLRAGGAGR